MPAWRVLNVLSSIKATVEVVEETHGEDYTYWETGKPVALPWATLPEKTMWWELLENIGCY